MEHGKVACCLAGQHLVKGPNPSRIAQKTSIPECDVLTLTELRERKVYTCSCVSGDPGTSLAFEALCNFSAPSTTLVINPRCLLQPNIASAMEHSIYTISVEHCITVGWLR